jgi:hypothetical protein
VHTKQERTAELLILKPFHITGDKVDGTNPQQSTQRINAHISQLSAPPVYKQLVELIGTGIGKGNKTG